MGGLLAGLQFGRIRPAGLLQGEAGESIRTGIGRVGSSVPTSFLAILAFWLVTFTSHGVFAPRTAPVLVVLVLCAISVASADFLVLELEGPFEGPVRVSGDPLVAVLGHMNR